MDGGPRLRTPLSDGAAHVSTPTRITTSPMAAFTPGGWANANPVFGVPGMPYPMMAWGMVTPFAAKSLESTSQPRLVDPMRNWAVFEQEWSKYAQCLVQAGGWPGQDGQLVQLLHACLDSGSAAWLEGQRLKNPLLSYEEPRRELNHKYSGDLAQSDRKR